MKNPLLGQPLKPDQNYLKRNWETGLFLVLLLIISLVYWATLYPDQNWGDDFAQYIHQAINLSQGLDMMDTGYIYSRYTPSLGPRAYPPGFPLLLAPVYATFGLDMRAFQVQIILMQLLALVVIYLLYRREVSLPTALILLLMMGLSPYVISFKREIRSDVPFMLVSLAFVLWVEHVYQQQRFDRRAVLVAALLAFACYLIRTIGFVMLGALLVSDLIRLRRPTSFTLLTIISTTILVVISRFLLGGGEESYFDQFAGYSPLMIVAGFVHYLIHSIRGFWAGSSLTLSDNFIVPILWLMAIPLIIYGFRQRARRSTLFMEFFFLFHLGIILAWPSVQELRFLYPILPLFLLYLGIGFEAGLARLAQRTSRQLAVTVAIIFAVGIIGIYGLRASKVIAAEAPIADGPYVPTATALFQFVTHETPAESVFIFYKPRALSLYAQRSASIFPYNQPMPIALAYLEEIGANYLIIKKDDKSQPNLTPSLLVKTCPDGFEAVFDNEAFMVYHLKQNRLNSCQEKMLAGG
jgi:hypothetical protein